ncbi:MAG TPA: sigma 54-interacting transcriptional regulator [Bacteroidota bacterium]|nr:sigma 54-interacting transcriptional regulator [Bacteroidota bacterium]
MQGTAVKSDLPDDAPRGGIAGESMQMRKIAEVVEQVAPTDITVLITGESGVGKEVIAKAIHAESRRSARPMITVNSGAIPEGIIESELFGHERGSFTGASDQRKGYFELADGGTLFLDEIGELPLGSQVKFLRVLENGEFLRVGSSTPRRVNVRVIAATNRDLETAVRHGSFRADLFFRLRSVNIAVPPLRERPDDIPFFFRLFADDVARKNGVPFHGIADAAMDVLRSYRWPGNVRELRNTVESMIVLEKGKYLEAEDVRRYLPPDAPPSGEERLLPVPVGRSVEQAERELILRALLELKGNIMELRAMLDEQRQALDATKRTAGGAVAESGMSLEEMEHRLIAEALSRSKGNRRMAARALNISERTLYRKIKEYHLE